MHADCQGPTVVRYGRVENEAATIRRQRVYRLILSYLSEHPDAEDSIDGILQWWLLQEEIRFRVQEVEAALTDLVHQGIVVERIGKDLRPRYQIDRSRYQYAIEILKGMSD